MEVTAGQECCNGVRFYQSADVGGLQVFKVVAARGTELDAQARRAGVRKLLGMYARAEAVLFSRSEDLPGVG